MEFLVFLSEQWLLVGLLLILAYLLLLSERVKAGKPASAQEATNLINSANARVVDLRDQDDFRAGHIVDSVHIPHSELAKRLNELATPKDKPIILVDKMGQHTGAAGRLLKREGFEVRRLQGGISEWVNQKLPLVKN